MTVVLTISAVLLAVAAVLLVIRMSLGPTTLDRIIAFDVLVAVTICAIGLEAALNQHATTLPLLAVLALLGFISSASVASFTKGSETLEEDES